MNLSKEQIVELSKTLGPEFTASAKNDLLNFATKLASFKQEAKHEKAVVEEKEAPKEEAKPAPVVAKKETHTKKA